MYGDAYSYYRFKYRLYDIVGNLIRRRNILKNSEVFFDKNIYIDEENNRGNALIFEGDKNTSVFVSRYYS
jgi:hypothetical protein